MYMHTTPAQNARPVNGVARYFSHYFDFRACSPSGVNSLQTNAIQNCLLAAEVGLGCRRAAPGGRKIGARTGGRSAGHRHRIPQNIAAAPYRLDVMAAAGRLGELFAQLADKNVNDL